MTLASFALPHMKLEKPFRDASAENAKRQSKPGKTRLDVLIVERGLAPSRERAQALLLAGQIRVNGAPAAKPGTQVATDSQIELSGEKLRYASRGGLKLEAALKISACRPKIKYASTLEVLQAVLLIVFCSVARAKSLQWTSRSISSIGSCGRTSAW